MSGYGMTLEEAMTKGRGTERPFRCPVHNDDHASASVNVVKGVWFCHACFAKGRTEDKKTPTHEDIAAMLEPEAAATRYPAAYLEVFDVLVRHDAYWFERLHRWTVHHMSMGQDPFTGAATFPVYTPEGHLAGVGRRFVTEDGKRYLYPKGWSASTNLGGLHGRYPPTPVLCITEGYADAAAVAETGCPAVCQWGSQLHLPQLELISRFNPALILLGQDMDEAGERGVSMAFAQLRRVAPLARVRWTKKDPLEMEVDARIAALERAVGGSAYSEDVLPRWHRAREAMVTRWEQAMKEAS